ncbi:peptide ligase PGM1-related protein [uncultured Phycicoccus sp.]|uniref:peptide ligase PGM1-related protein n=1 Tax=uncultured Phycicoccus sp. TaxID=661422 RepID=UPI002627F27D|nr:peptide ligase PGM1-related protein [uncultured Phycicoccus sp.]
MAWDENQQRLAAALRAHRPGSGVPHVVVSLPSLSIAASLLAHYGARLPVLEHRYLLGLTRLARVRDCELVFVCSVAPSADVVDDYLDLLPARDRADCRRRFRVLAVGDPSPRALSAKLLARPDLVERLRQWVGDRPAFLDPWNVTGDEVRIADALGMPVNGTAPHLEVLARKSAGRRLLRDAGVPVPVGVEDVRSPEAVLAAVADLRGSLPGCHGVVVKTDDSGAGDGNRVLRWDEEDRPCDSVAAFPDWYVADLAEGGIVEELVEGVRFASPSVQVDLVPDGPPQVLATHEQVLGGEGGQVYQGCTFPAADEYAARLGEYGLAAARTLARRGALGRLSVDFAVSSAPGEPWRIAALEMNLRKGGTTHPLDALSSLVPGRYDVAAARWVTRDGSSRFYEATDNLVDPAWRGREARDVLDAVRAAGLRFDPVTGVGVVMHMLLGLEVDGRIGLTAIGRSREHAADLFLRTGEVLRA